MLDRTQLPKDTQTELKHLLGQDKESLTPEQIAFLKARSSYLTEEEVIRFGLESEDAPSDEYGTMTLKQLVALAAEREIEVPEKAKKADVIALLRAAPQASNSNADAA